MTESSSTKRRRPTLPPTRAVACADEIRLRILDGTYNGGMQLRQDALAEELGVSRIPVREALVQLEAEGLVRIRPNRGAIVSEISAEEISELFEMRALLEPRLLELSAPRLTEDDFAALKLLLEGYASDLRNTNLQTWGEYNTRLHKLLYRHAGRSRMESAVFQLLTASDRYTRMQIYYTDGQERAEREHEMIVNLCEHKQFLAAAELLRSHIMRSGEDLTKLIIDRQQQGAA